MTIHAFTTTGHARCGSRPLDDGDEPASHDLAEVTCPVCLRLVADTYLHRFATILPPSVADRPVCGAELSRDWQGRGKPPCPTCEAVFQRLTTLSASEHRRLLALPASELQAALRQLAQPKTPPPDPLLDALRKLTQLLEDPWPGLATWNIATEAAASAVEREIAAARRSI